MYEESFPLKCEANTCQNGGTCVDDPDSKFKSIGFKCVCPSGYFGYLCERGFHFIKFNILKSF